MLYAINLLYLQRFPRPKCDNNYRTGYLFVCVFVKTRCKDSYNSQFCYHFGSKYNFY